ncbi:NAD(P)H-hydrate dehydratase [Mycetocola zhadangensis]|uniref:ADP-dependent (S)-NAD(P)H-hydrate dehydratase n=1 Tax=Mycetocola zhadangensis TaxID=1164595 RepID=A0A3L7J1L4_9MICO|nr:NAD(P)H-hydrate dehydratase [Mycetocola zhadangensis]RLQ84289.1 NAD(P)H-hydrate dehydratase [Mycetocola zhadangensis]GGE94359.1 ADP-dependent (S)-NAD(P)H-hydrate dehydratase [Mycetocola zhadangensis]
MSTRTDPSDHVVVTPNLLREWALPEASDSKYGRGTVLIVGGARRSPGAAMLAGMAALRVGAGRLTLAVAGSVAAPVAVAVPESGIVFLPETADGAVSGDGLAVAEKDLSSSDAVLVGPGLDDPDELKVMLSTLPSLLGEETVVVLDAFALGVLPGVPDAVSALAGRLLLTPNKGEAERLLERDLGDDLATDIAEIAERYGAVVTCYDVIAHPDGRVWRTGTGAGGLATSGSGDVLAGAITGLCARGASLEQAAVWATHAHAAAGDRLAVQVGPMGFLARELLDEFPRVLVEING